MLARGPRRWWPWMVAAIIVHLALFTAIVLMAQERVAELERRIETLQEWREELGEAAAGLHDTVTTLSGELAKLHREAEAEADLRDGLVRVKERVDRIEAMVSALWRAPTGRAQLGATS